MLLLTSLKPTPIVPFRRLRVAGQLWLASKDFLHEFKRFEGENQCLAAEEEDESIVTLMSQLGESSKLLAHTLSPKKIGLLCLDSEEVIEVDFLRHVVQSVIENDLATVRHQGVTLADHDTLPHEWWHSLEHCFLLLPRHFNLDLECLQVESGE